MKERMLTVLVPINDSDATIVQSLPPVNPDNVNVIFKYDGKYYRVFYDRYSKTYQYKEVVDREFPELGKPLEIFDFSYDATRMGTAPIISSQNVKWYAKKDENGNDVTLEDIWRQDCHVVFNGENFYLKRIPTSSKSHEDARYTYDLDFVSERVVLEQVYIYDVVQPFVNEKPITESSSFRFFGDINELVKRINSSLIRSNLASVKLLPGVTEESYLTYDEFNSVGRRSYTGRKDTSDPYPNIPGFEPIVHGHHVHHNIYKHFGGNYTKYLLNRVYVVENEQSIHIGPPNIGYDEIYDGDIAIEGYQCRIGKGKTGDDIVSEEKLLEFDNLTIHEALQKFHDDFGLQYYIYKEKDEQGEFTGNTIIMVADCEHDFADMNQSGTDYVRDDEGIPTTEHPFDYGVDNALLSKEKTNTTDKIITRITGVGSEENIPWYYPNPTADGWIKPVYKKSGVEQEVEIGYPTQESDNRYEKYLKNRIGHTFNYGKTVKKIMKNDYAVAGFVNSNLSLVATYYFNTRNFINPADLLLKFNIQNDSNAGNVVAYLKASPIVGDVANNWSTLDKYNSNATYENPTPFQSAMISGNQDVAIELDNNYQYSIELYINRANGVYGMWPYSRMYDYSGYYYPATSMTHGGSVGYIADGFYDVDNLVPFVNWDGNVPTWSGYSAGPSNSGRKEPYQRKLNGKYRDIGTGTIYQCITEMRPSPLNSLYQTGYRGNPTMDYKEWIDTFLTFEIDVVKKDGWYKDGKLVNLSDYGMELPQLEEITIFDSITFQRVKYLTPQNRLMPEVYIKTDGSERFYVAHNYYPLKEGTPNTYIGETYKEGTSYIINPLYKENETDTDDKHYNFENEYIRNIPKEAIVEFDDVKPTIKGQTNTITISGVERTFRIDVVEEFSYDEMDNDEIWEDNSDGNISGEYKHPFFFAKLRPMGFNLFDLALSEDMVLSMTTGNCGSCNFRIGVDEQTKKNPVQIWEYDVYEGATWSSKILRYNAGTLRRYVDITDLYYDTDGTESGYKKVNYGGSIMSGFLVNGDRRKTMDANFMRTVYSADAVKLGEVGSLRQEPKSHFEGDVVVSGKFIQSQQDTSENYVWVALYKDTDSYGTIMPSSKPDYGDNTYSVYIDPKGATYNNRKTGEIQQYTDDDADKFVIINIRFPQIYLRRAEHELSRRLIEHMYENNYQKFNFSIDFSRVFIAQNQEVDDKLNENSVLYVNFNRRTYRQYVKSYSYKMEHDKPLPEIKVDMNEELSVSRTLNERQEEQKRQSVTENKKSLDAVIRNTKREIERKTIGRTDDMIVSGNIVSWDSVTSMNDMKAGFGELSKKTMIIDDNVVTQKVDFDVFSDKCDEFNTSVANTVNAMKTTIEERLIPLTTFVSDTTCGFVIKHYEVSHDNPNGYYFWYDYDGQKKEIPDNCPAYETNGMDNIEWNMD